MGKWEKLAGIVTIFAVAIATQLRSDDTSSTCPVVSSDQELENGCSGKSVSSSCCTKDQWIKDEKGKFVCSQPNGVCHLTKTRDLGCFCDTSVQKENICPQLPSHEAQSTGCSGMEKGAPCCTVDALSYNLMGQKVCKTPNGVCMMSSAGNCMCQVNAGAHGTRTVSTEGGADRTSKLQAVMNKLYETKYKSLPMYTGSDITVPWNFMRFTTQDLSTSFDMAQDTLPPGHGKYIHALGVVGAVKFVPSKYNEYTGLFRGADACLTRLSLAIHPWYPTGYTPGTGIKCFRDGKENPSGNILAMYGLDGQGNNANFFAHEFSNIIAQPGGLMKVFATTIFGRASKCPVWVSNKNFAEMDQYGTAPKAGMKWPQQIYLVPLISFPEESHGDLRQDLLSIKPGTAIWRMESVDKKGDPQDTRQVLGTWVTTSEFIASEYGDTELFFQHVRGEEDGCHEMPVVSTFTEKVKSATTGKKVEH